MKGLTVKLEDKSILKIKRNDVIRICLSLKTGIHILFWLRSTIVSSKDIIQIIDC